MSTEQTIVYDGLAVANNTEMRMKFNWSGVESIRRRRLGTFDHPHFSQTVAKLAAHGAAADKISHDRISQSSPITRVASSFIHQLDQSVADDPLFHSNLNPQLACGIRSQSRPCRLRIGHFVHVLYPLVRLHAVPVRRSL